MKRLFVLVLISVPTFIFAQESIKFRIIGHSEFYNNKNLFIQGGIFPESFGYNDFKFENGKMDSIDNSYRLVQLQNNQFLITGIQKYPHPFIISYYDSEINKGYNSYRFFIDEGTANIELGNLVTNKNLGSYLNSKTNKEYNCLKKEYSNFVDTITGEIHNMQAKQRVIRKYIIQNPNSYAALWDMVLDYPIVRSNNEKESILKNTYFFSTKIKKTKTYVTLVNNIKKDLELNVGKIFPNIFLNRSDSLFKFVYKNKFTLVDFWFSACAPCVAQFPHYNKIYNSYKENQFEIIGISVDGKEADWKKAIQKFHLEWQQYLDLSGKETDKYYIRKFPTNFLLDNTGRVIKMDITPQDLETFLQKNIN